MFLKRIELFGFKSFADKTVIELKGNIIAILGPNGCGKSNIADAVKWVMGEQSGKTLRVEKMEDLIFGGSESRRALNVAEISLTFENDLPDFAFSEISVKRRIFRNGESEYFVNNVPVKLRNMKEQLFDIGIGKSAYSIIEQGKVDQILSSRAEDRRYIFEEAAGISRHRNKWKEASKKLEQVYTNIKHIESVLSEVKRSYNNLKKQAEKAEEYRTLKNTVFELERNRYLLRLRKYQEQRDRKERDIRHTGAAREDVQQEIDHINKYLETNLDQVRRMEGTLNDAHRQLYGMSIEKKNLQSQKSALAERMQDIEERIRQDKDGEENLQQLNDVLKKENDETAAHIQECGGRLTGLDDNIRDFEDQVKSAQNRIDENSREETRIVKETRSLEKQLVELQEDLQKLTDDIVRELDEQLKTANPASREEASEHLNTLLAQQAQLIKRYRQRLADIPNASEKELSAFFEAFLREFESICRDMSAGVEEYRKNVPSFIEEFLAPGGIIMQKRDIDHRLFEIRKHVDNNRQRIDTLQKENTEWNNKIDECHTTLRELLISIERIRAEKKSLEKERTKSRNRIEELKGQIQNHREKIAEDEGRLLGLSKRGEELNREREHIRKQEEQIQKDIEKFQKDIAGEQKQHSLKDTQRKKLLKRLSEAQERHETEKISLVELNTEIRNLQNRFREQYSHDLHEFTDLRIKTPLDQIKKQLQTLQEKLRSFSAVNLMAVEEFNEVRERHDFLQKQLTDLTEAQGDLQQVIGQIQDESLRLFMESYRQIQINFNELFRKLFGGGRAEVRMLEPENQLESGIDIYAQPPGKKLENITLLSGGERSLAAIALVFAAYMLRPAPFCFLDEIDAALDESNIGHFAGVLKDFSRHSQFIIVSHNKKTMIAADTLLGVTMQESGVSKVVAVRMRGADALEKNQEKNPDART